MWGHGHKTDCFFQKIIKKNNRGNFMASSVLCQRADRHLRNFILYQTKSHGNACDLKVSLYLLVLAGSVALERLVW